MTNTEEPTAEVVNTEEVTEVVETQEEINKETFEKLKEIEKNKSIALKQEREEKQAIQAKLAEYEKAEQERLEKKKKEQGKYEELLAEKEARLAELETKATAYDELQAKLTAQKEEELTGLLEKVPANLQEKYAAITGKLDLEDKVAFYKNIMEDYEKKDFDANPKGKGEDINKKEQPKKGDILSFIKNAPKL